MKIKRIIAIVLAMLLLLSTAACAKTEKDTKAPADTSDQKTETETGSESDTKPDTSEDSETPALSGLNHAAAYKAYDPDEVVLTVGTRDYTWKEYFYVVYYFVNYIIAVNGQMPGWDTEIVIDQTMAEYVKDSTAQWFIYDAAIRDNADKLGIVLDENDRSVLQASYDEITAKYGGEEGFKKEMESFYCYEELYKGLQESTYLSNKCYEVQYGATGELLSDEEVADYISDVGYMMAKHILIKNTELNDEGVSVDKTEEQKAEDMKKLLDIKTELEKLDETQVEAKFDEYMKELSEDPGSIAYPDGYLFVHGEMVSEFENAVAALKPYHVSDIVETSYGYHLILALPINYDATPNMYAAQAASDGGVYTLRYLTSQEMFNELTESWKSGETVTYSELYNNLDLKAIFSD